jgi:LacI family gluconate utilization system Gnt-I transcriptional repressor
MDACRREIGQAAARIVLSDTDPESQAGTEVLRQQTLTPKLSYGDTLRRRRKA